ncbi:TRAM domain-containing protein, partial [Candidatus Marinimicrobia bacterium]|nr:TRAM domain-containing protein [Candidatus Neomarinimicrobiota bacterium]
EVKDYRKNQILEIQHDISLEKNELFIGKTIKVLVDQVGDKVSIGRTEFDSPEIDNIVHIKGATEKGSFVDVKISEANEYELIGEVV